MKVISLSCMQEHCILVGASQSKLVRRHTPLVEPEYKILQIPCGFLAVLCNSLYALQWNTKILQFRAVSCMLCNGIQESCSSVQFRAYSISKIQKRTRNPEIPAKFVYGECIPPKRILQEFPESLSIFVFLVNQGIYGKILEDQQAPESGILLIGKNSCRQNDQAHELLLIEFRQRNSKNQKRKNCE